jgi:hypothetical protein
MYWGLVRRPDAVVYHGIELIHLYRRAFRELRDVADRTATPSAPTASARSSSAAHASSTTPSSTEVDHLQGLRFRAGIRVSARLGGGNTGTGYALEPPERGGRRSRRASCVVAGAARPRTRTSHLPPAGPRRQRRRALAQIQARGLQRTANAIAAACDDLLGFFRQLRGELGFYVGCLNLHERLTRSARPTVRTEPLAGGTCSMPATSTTRAWRSRSARRWSATTSRPTADLIVVTGANQGGKTTFLRSVGSAQLMMQCGMFVPARYFHGAVATGLFTHFTREEDAAMRRGKLDEELSRLDAIVTEVGPGARCSSTSRSPPPTSARAPSSRRASSAR